MFADLIDESLKNAYIAVSLESRLKNQSNRLKTVINLFLRKLFPNIRASRVPAEPHPKAQNLGNTCWWTIAALERSSMTILISEMTAFFSCLIYASFFEWTLHKYLMHTPLWQYPFRAHALVHHGLFRTGTQYFLPDAKVIRKVRFAWWNAPFIIMLHTPVILWLQRLSGEAIFGGALLALILYYFLYEYLHYCMHIPKRRWLETTAWFRWLDSHHHMHHKRHFNNLNVVLPLADILFGTLIPAEEHMAVPDREDGASQVRLLLSET